MDTALSPRMLLGITMIYGFAVAILSVLEKGEDFRIAIIVGGIVVGGLWALWAVLRVKQR